MPWKESNVMDLRTEFVLKALDSRAIFKDLCAEYGISRKTGYKWKQRFLEDGLPGLQDLLRRPKSSPTQLTERQVCAIIKIKLAHLSWGPKKIREVYRRGYGEPPSLSSFKRVLDKAGLVKHRRTRRHRKYHRLTQLKKAQAPNEIWTVDFKGWWRLGDSRRCEPLTIRDEYSRYILAVRAMQTTSSQLTKVQFERVFKQYGIPKIIRSDNGGPFACTRAPLGLTRLSAWWIGQGIRLDRIEPGHPEQNGGHERMHRDIRMELQGLIKGGLKQHQASFDTWRQTFNHERPHEALEMKVPADLYTRSSRRYENINQIQYPQGFVTRKVSPSGTISLNKRFIFISTSLVGWDLGLKYSNSDQMEVWFDYLRMGTIDLNTESFNCVA